MPNDKPILMQPDMTRATLREIETPGTGKTVTRRLMMMPVCGGKKIPILHHMADTPEEAVFKAMGGKSGTPYGQDGDALWVRETLHKYSTNDMDFAAYAADGSPVLHPENTAGGYGDTWVHWHYSRNACPSIHMPRWASRISLLRIVIRPERLSFMTPEDFMREGIRTQLREHDAVMDLQQQFRKLWNGINEGRGAGWEANPWVWRIAFNPVLQNIDEALQEKRTTT